MAATNFKTENNTFRKLFGNGLTYRIPRFQRDYSWTSEEWEDLWMDILGTVDGDGESAHYMGYLVLQSSDDKTFDVIDGQQRLTTISLITLAVLKNFQNLIDSDVDAESNRRRMDQIRQTYVGYLDPVTLVSRPKLTLNSNNNNYYQNYLVPLGHLPQRGFRNSEHSLRKAFEWFDKRVATYLKDGKGDEGMRLASLVEDISDRLFFTVITVTDEMNAYKVFGTLNARGVLLSATDLLKNYLFSVLDRGGESGHELSVLEERWEAIVGRLQSENVPDFLRTHWNSRRSFARQADLFKTIRAQVGTAESVFQLLREMEEDLDTYLALSSPEPSEWLQEDKRLAGVLKTLRVRQPFPLLLSAKRVFDASDFTGLLRATVVISMRFNVIGSQSAAEQERKYNDVAERVAKREKVGLGSTLQLLRSVYPDDAGFKASFAEKSIRTMDSRNNRVVRYILCALETHLTQQAYDFASDAFNIEHVLPQRAPDNWGGIGNDDAEALVYRLGNMTLLQSGVNRDLGNNQYSQKRSTYRQSGFVITRKLADENVDWTPERIASRQKWMANQATAIWRISQLS
jgi:hypothetical protein